MAKKKQLDKGPSDIFLENAIKDGVAVKQLMSISKLTVDMKLQSREKNDVEHERYLASQLDEGYELRAIVVFYDRKVGKTWVADGFHRVAAYLARGRVAIPAYVIDGTYDDAVLFSVSANLWQGKSTGRNDRKKAVFMMLDNEQHRMLADTAIGLRCGVSNTTASSYRLEHSKKTGTPIPDYVIRSDGAKTPYKQSTAKRAFNGIPLRDGRADGYFSANFGGKTLYGNSEDSIKNKLKEAIDSRKQKINKLSAGSIQSRLTRQGLYFKSALKSFSGYHGISGYYDDNTAFVTSDFSDTRSIFVALGRLDMIDALCGPGLRKVVVCYAEYGNQNIIELMRSHGVEFLTPEELVASIKTEGEADRESA